MWTKELRRKTILREKGVDFILLTVWLVLVKITFLSFTFLLVKYGTSMSKLIKNRMGERTEADG